MKTPLLHSPSRYLPHLQPHSSREGEQSPVLTPAGTPGLSHLSPAHTYRHTWPLPSLSCSHLQAHLASPISLLLTPAGTPGHSHLSPAHTCRHIWTLPYLSCSHLQAHPASPISLPLTPAGTPSLSHLVPAQPSWLFLGAQKALLAEVGSPQTLCSPRFTGRQSCLSTPTPGLQYSLGHFCLQSFPLKTNI